MRQRFPMAADRKDPFRGPGRVWHRGGIGHGLQTSCRWCLEGVEELRGPPAAEPRLLQGTARGASVDGPDFPWRAAEWRGVAARAEARRRAIAARVHNGVGCGVTGTTHNR
ncbi:hypothetical protein NDU88_002362 [Pleurodeles waltl]|uniref:Uncharacterized protein n=1 Tax=Pleurodeles waltl TaxID=8319 RepID=A0AAV7UX22_PLEWA|nr:hypothetical protein NDU88_002362 [Pleurodeles waltl]